MQSILVLEDNPDIREIYESILSQEFVVNAVGSLNELKKAIEAALAPPDLLLADICLPDGMFLSLLKSAPWSEKLREWPILVVSSLDDMETIESVMAIRDIDYITKPFNKNELLAKCRRMMKKPPKPLMALDATSLRFVAPGGLSEPLTAVESKIAHMLLGSEGHGVSRRSLSKAIWDEDRHSKKLDVHMTRIRKKLHPIGVGIRFRDPDLYFLGMLPAGGKDAEHDE